MVKKFRLYALLAFLLVAAPSVSARPVLVILADHLTLNDVRRPDLPNIARMCREGQVLLMSPGLAHGADPVATVYATLGAGDTVQPGEISSGLLARTLRADGVTYAVIGNADGDDTGPYRPANLFLPDVLSPGPSALSGHVFHPDPGAPGGKSVDATGLASVVRTALSQDRLVVVHHGDFSRLERENRAGLLLPVAYAAHRARILINFDSFIGRLIDQVRDNPSMQGLDGTEVLLVSPTPPLNPDGTWNRLTPFVQWRPGPKQATLVLSDTTHTPGLIAARDIAPTILHELGLQVPYTMTGAPLRPDSSPRASADLTKTVDSLDRITWLNATVQIPLFWFIGIVGAAIVLGGIVLYLLRALTVGGPGVRIWLFTLRMVAAWPLALLLAPVAAPHTVSGYLAVIVGLTVLLAVIPRPEWIYAGMAVLLVVDGLFGSPLVSHSVLSAYALAGIRFYGIGNEYMGLLLGGAMLVAMAIRGPGEAGEDSGSEDSGFPPPQSPLRTGGRPDRTQDRKYPVPLLILGGVRGGGLFLWFAFVTFVLSCPAFGAKAGGAVTAVATFTMAWRLLMGKPAGLRHLALGLAGGFLLVFVWAGASAAFGLRETHMQTAVTALLHGRFGYILGVVVRKAGLAAHVLLHPGTLWGILGLALVAVCARIWFWPWTAGYLAARPRFAAVFIAGLWGCVVAFLFNDSGIVAAILMFSSLILPLIHGMFSSHAPSRT